MGRPIPQVEEAGRGKKGPDWSSKRRLAEATDAKEWLAAVGAAFAYAVDKLRIGDDVEAARPIGVESFLTQGEWKALLDAARTEACKPGKPDSTGGPNG